MENKVKHLKVAFLWHQHQPNYYHPGKEIFILPWVRMHALKDYYDMVAILDDYPEIHQNVNLVPSLLAQLQDYIDDKCQDRIEILTNKNVSDLTQSEQIQILKYFFQANWKNQVEIYPGYKNLLQKRGRHFDPQNPQTALNNYSKQDFLDLQIWFNLSWVGEIYKKKEPFKSLIIKDHGFSTEDKINLMKAQRKLLKNVIEKHKELLENGQIELSTTPYYHPILPLLCDSSIAKESQPGIQLPEKLFQAREDAADQIKRAIHFHEKIFGQKPLGMWPSEGSVSEEVAELFAANEMNWIATDEEILFSTWHKLGWQNRSREELYQSWKYDSTSGPINIFFRDHELSDLIGFVYQKWDAEQAANDFITKLKNIRKNIIHRFGEKRLDKAIVSIILDGENCWEFYKENGKPFLQALYSSLTTEQSLKTVTFSEYLTKSEESEKLPRLFPGSWINHNFAIWIGHPEDNQAWDYLYKARQAWQTAKNSGSYSDDVIAQAHEGILIAEGSDWYWWYGDDHTNENADEFDEIFRHHLIRMYELLNLDVPAHLYQSIRQGGHKKHLSCKPMGFISPVIDGIETNYFEWLGAGSYDTKVQGDSMHQMSQFVESIDFGFDLNNFYIKVITDQQFSKKHLFDYEIEVCIFEPGRINILVNLGSLAKKGMNNSLSVRKNGKSIDNPVGIKAAFKSFLELKIPFDDFDGAPADKVQYQIKLFRNKKLIEKWPKEELIECEIPGPEFEKIEWRV